ncbi:MAG: hypothetical protein ACOCP4_06270, partial [Candidatus Woesearchaeota archaeon]
CHILSNIQGYIKFSTRHIFREVLRSKNLEEDLQCFGTVKPLIVFPEYLENLIFSSEFGEAEKTKVERQCIPL